MSRKVYLIKDITPKTDPRWWAKVRVLEKHSTKSSGNSPKKFQKYVFGDEEGTRVQAIIWSSEIKLFERRLHPFGAYYIARAYVKPISVKYQLVKHPFEWVIQAKTVIEECEHPVPELIAAPLEFAPFSVFPAYMNSTSDLDIIAVVMDIDLPRKIETKYGTSYVQNAIIINQELKPIMLTFWDTHVENECINIYNQRAKNPVIIVFRAKVVPFNGMSLSASNTSGVVIAPEIPVALELHAWFDQNEVSIKKDFKPANYYSSTASAATEDNKELKTLAEGLTMSENTMFWSKVSISVINTLQRFYYMSCSNCMKGSGFDHGETYYCNHCKYETAIATPRCIVEIQLKDHTSLIHAQIYGQLAESIIGCTAYDLMVATQKGSSDQLQQIIKVNEAAIYFVQLKALENTFQGSTTKKFSVYKLQVCPDNHETNDLVTSSSDAVPANPTDQSEHLNLTPPDVPSASPEL